MSEKLNFQIEFEFAQQTLKKIRSDLKRQLSNIQVDIDPKVRRTVTKGTQSQIAGARGKISGEIEKLQRKQARAIEKFSSAQEKLTRATERVTTLTESSINITKRGRAEVATLNRSIGQLRKSSREAANEMLALNPVIGNLLAAMENSTGAFAKFESGKSAELENLLKELLDSVGNASDEFKRIIGGGRTLDINKVLSLFAARIERDVLPPFEALGLTATQQEGLIRSAISRFAQKIEDAGFTLPEGEFDALQTESSNLSQQEKRLNASVAKLRGATRSKIRVIEEGIASEKEGRGLNSATNRIQEQAIIATNELAESLRKRARAIRTLSIDEILSPRLIEFANRLERSATDLEIASRPIRSVGERAKTLAIRFGKIGTGITKTLLPEASKDQLIKGASLLSDIFKKTGGNIDKTAEKFVTSFDGVAESQENIRTIINLLKSGLENAKKQTVELANSEKQYADSLRGAATQLLQRESSGELTAARKSFVDVLKGASSSLRGFGKTRAELSEIGKEAEALSGGLQNVRLSILAALDPGQLTFLKQAGVDVDSLVREVINRSGISFEEEFLKTSKRIASKLEKEAAIGAKELVNNLKNIGTKQILSPNFIEDAFSNIAREFPRLSEQIIGDIIKPLRNQIKKAADSRAKTDSQIEGIRNKQKLAEEELVGRINKSFKIDESAIGAGTINRANQALANVFKSVSGKIRNAFSFEEKSILESAKKREATSKEIISLLDVQLSARIDELRSIRLSQAAAAKAARGLGIASKALASRNSGLVQEIANLEVEVRGAEEAFSGFETMGKLRQKLFELTEKQVRVQQQLVNTQIEEKRALDEEEGSASRFAGLQRELLIIQSDRKTTEERLNSAVKDAANIQEKQNRRIASGKGGDGVGGSGPLRDFSIQSLKDFGQKLDLKQQARFIELLKKEDINLKTVNTQLKAHQGNIAKSNNLVDELTTGLTSGQKAAFQFGFAAASAADRLLAWASPAAFIFSAISSLREAVSTIIRLDSEVARIAFFNPETLDRIAAGIGGLAEKLNNAGEEAKTTKGAFDRLSSSTQRLAVLSNAAAEAQKNLISRSKQTGIELEKLTQIALVSGRVGREAFSETGQLNPFAEAVEGLIRLEGETADATKLTAQLNSILNQFKLTGQDASVVAAQLAEASRRTGFSASELAEGLTRVAGAFSTIQRASPAQTLEFLTAAGNTTQTSISRVSTAFRQMSTRIASSAEKIKEFAGLDIIEDGKIKGPEALVEVLKVINSFKGEQAAIDFIKQFTDERQAAVILSAARGVEELEKRIKTLGTTGGEVNAALRAQSGFLSGVAAQSRRLDSEIEKLRSTVTSLVSKSGFIEFLSGTVRAGKRAVGIFNSIAGVIGGLGGAFAVVSAIALPALQNIARGFGAGLLTSQKQAEVLNKINLALAEQKNIAQAVVLAKDEGLIKEELANGLAQRATNLAVQKAGIQEKINILLLEEAAEKSALVPNAEKIAAIEKKRELQQRRLNTAVAEENVLRDKARKILGDPASRPGFKESFTKNFGARISQAMLIGGTVAAPIIGRAVGKAIGEETGKRVESAIQGALPGLLIGASFGGLQAVIGGLITGGLALLNAQAELNEKKEQELKITEKLEKTIKRADELKAIRDAVELEISQNISDRNKEIFFIRSQIESLDIRINAKGRERAENEGLIERRQGAQVKLQQLLAQQKTLEADQLGKQVLFEEKITNLKREQQFLTKTSNLIQKAQIALLEQGARTPVLEVKIRAETDKRNIAIQKKFIEEQISLIDKNILDTELKLNAKQEIKKLSKQRIGLQNDLIDLDLEALNKRFETGLELLKREEEVTDKKIESFKSVGGFLNDAFSNLISSQEKIVNLIGEEADIFSNIAEAQRGTIETAARGQGLGVTGDVGDLSIKQQQDIIRKRNKIIEDGARRSMELFSRQLKEIGDVPTIEQLAISTKILKEQIDAAGGQFAQFSDVVSRTRILQLEQIESGRQLFDIQRGQTLKRIELEKTLAQQENDIVRNKISLINEEISVIQKRIDKEAEIGKKLINAPDEFLKETSRLFESRDILRQANVTQKNVEDGLLRVIQEVSRVQGFSGLQRVLQGLEVAQSRDETLVTGVGPEQLTNLFARLVANPNAKIAKESLNKQDVLINKIGNLFEQIQNNNAKQLILIKQQQDVEELFKKTLPDLGKKQIESIKENTTIVRQNALASIANLKIVKDNFKIFAKNIEGLKNELLKKINKTLGDRDTVRAINKVENILNEIADASPEVRSARDVDEQLQKNLSRAVALSTGKLTKELGEDFNRFIKIQQGSIPEELNKIGETIATAQDKLLVINKKQIEFDRANKRLVELREKVSTPSKLLVTDTGPIVVEAIASGFELLKEGLSGARVGGGGDEFLRVSEEEEKQRKILAETIKESIKIREELFKSLTNGATVFKDAFSETELEKIRKRFEIVGRNLDEDLKNATEQTKKPLEDLGNAAKNAAKNLGNVGSSPQAFASGGKVPGFGSKDTIPALLTPGEFVVNKRSTRKNLRRLMAMNDGRIQGFASGGLVEIDPDNRTRRFDASANKNTIRKIENVLELHFGSENRRLPAGKEQKLIFQRAEEELKNIRDSGGNTVSELVILRNALTDEGQKNRKAFSTALRAESKRARADEARAISDAFRTELDNLRGPGAEGPRQEAGNPPQQRALRELEGRASTLERFALAREAQAKDAGEGASAAAGASSFARENLQRKEIEGRRRRQQQEDRILSGRRLFDFGPDREPRALSKEDPMFSVEAQVNDAVRSIDSRILKEKIVSQANARDRKEPLQDVLDNIFNDPLARQIASMERIVAQNETATGAGNLDADTLAVLKDGLEEAKKQFNLQHGSLERLDEIRDNINKPSTQLPDLDPFAATSTKPVGGAKNVEARVEESNKKMVAAQAPLVENSKKALEQGAATVATLDAIAKTASKNADAINKLSSALEQRRTSKAIDVFKIDEASQQDFIDMFAQKFNEAGEAWVQQFVQAVNDGVLDVEVAPVEIGLNANISTIINGEDFVQQLTQALLNTGLEDSVEDIQEVLNKLVQLEIGRSGNDLGNKTRARGSGPRGARPGSEK